MNDLSPSRIVCAAIRNPDGRIVCGPRHFDHTMWRQIFNVVDLGEPGFEPPLTDDAKTWRRAEEGFIDQHGVFMNREEAWTIALQNRQVIREHDWQYGHLHSEHLY